MKLDQEITEMEMEFLTLLLKNVFNSCDSFINDVKKCKNFNELKLLSMRNGNNISEKLGVYFKDEIDDLNDEIYDLKEEIKDLKDEILYLSEEKRNREKIETLYDVMRVDVFHKYAKKYTPFELEERLTSK